MIKLRVSNLYSLCCLAAIAVVSASGQAVDAGKTENSFNSLTRTEVDLLVADAVRSKPELLQRFAEDPDLKRTQIRHLRELLAFASQAQKEGMTADPTNRQELENIRAEIIAVNYDKMLNKGQPATPAFGNITAAQVAKYVSVAGHEPEFARFLDAKMKLVGAETPDRKLTAEEMSQARDVFARTQIYLAEYESKLKGGTLASEMVASTDLSVKLQQAQFLARLYAEKSEAQTKVTDAEITAYFTAHPKIDPARRRAEAQRILERAKAGEDFAALANEFSEDPGNIRESGAKAGGLYSNVPVGRFLEAFETAALALQPGQVAGELVETDHGYHVIKLERKLGKKRPTDEATYDVRHILISTNVEDPDSPDGASIPAAEFARRKLESEKDAALIAKLILQNNVQVPDDFTLPTPATAKPPVRNR